MTILMEEKLKLPYKNGFIKIVDINLDFLSDINYTSIRKTKRDLLERLLYIFVCSDKEILNKIYIGDKLMERIKNTLFGIDLDEIDDYLFYDREQFKKDAAFYAGEEQGIEMEKKKSEKKH